MPSFNRRGFMQLMSAAVATPLLPSLPARAVAATASASTSKALWAGIYAKSGSVPKFLNVARNMGLSNAAIQGVSARSVGVRVAISAATSPISRIAGTGQATLPSPISSQAEQLKASRDIVHDIERALSIETDEAAATVDQDAEALDTPNEPENDIS